jgi:alginate O-acetyltransferase complex protein AlgI
MTFTSFNFLLFFPLLAVLYWLTPSKYRWITLLIASYFFYINIKPVFALLLACMTLTTYLFARLIDNTTIESEKKRYLVINVVLILLPLVFFKYFISINNAINIFLESSHLKWPLPEIKLILPIGISFYTFMAIGYIVDVYNEDIKSEKNIGILALFFSFFPLILSGPIERAKNMLHQFKAQKNDNYKLIVQGLKFLIWGYFMKLVVANRIGIYVDIVYSDVSYYNGTSLLFASILYPFQVYADLGGYSLIAIGTANMLGINVMQNFKRPFFATSMSEFWRRWHISLISWLTDYVYTPLSFAFRKYKIWGIVIALMITFFISGIWHGAALTFVLWGLIQGILLSIEALTNKKRTLVENKFNLNKKSWYILFGICLTFIFFAISQIFGRSSNIGDAFTIFHRMFTTKGALFIGSPTNLIYGISGLLMLLIKDFTEEYTPTRFLLFENKYRYIRLAAYGSIFVLTILLGVFDSGQFIYFQF